MSDPIGFDSDGVVTGVVFLDRNGNGQVDPTVDTPVPGVRISLAPGTATGPSAASVVANNQGIFVAQTVPVGTYYVTVDPATVSDTLQVAHVDSARVTVSAGDTAVVMVRLGYPVHTVRSARQSRQGLVVTLEGVVLNARGQFGDSTVSLRDSTGAIRLTSVPPIPLVEGDSVRVVGRIGTRAGQPTVAEPIFFGLGRATVTPRLVTAAEAITARGGTLDAELVELRGTVSRDPVNVPGDDTRIDVTDATGTVQVRFDRDAGINPSLPTRVGGEIVAIGILVPVDGSTTEWQLKPRASADVRMSFPLTSIADARLLPGRFLRIRGTALNDGAAFLDRAVHLADGASAIRVVPAAPSTVLTGELAEVHGEVVTIGDAQLAVSGTSLVLVGPRTVPVPIGVDSTAHAASADRGRLDGALVSLRGATIRRAVPFGNDVLLEVNDGSGVLNVLIATTSGIDTRELVQDRVVDLVGLLVPAGLRTWRLRVRAVGDVILR